MKLKRSISLLLLAVYLFATAGTALASLTCKCVAMKARTEHACCCHCLHVADLPAAAGGEMRAPCCGNHHSTEIELYVSSSFDNNERYTRCIVLDLPPALAAECDHVAVAQRRVEVLDDSSGKPAYSPSASALLPYWLKTPSGPVSCTPVRNQF